MAKRNYFSFSLQGIETVIQNINEIEKLQDKRLAEALNNLANHIESEARKLAPNDSGDLEGAINRGEIRKTIQRMYVDIGVSPNVEHYAVRMHEDVYKPRDPEKQKPYKGVMPGRKYLENAIKINEEYIIKTLQTALDLGD